MKIITVPADVVITFTTQHGDKDEALPFKKVLVHQMDTFDQVKTRAQIRQAEKIVKVIEESNGTISLEDADFNILNDACREFRFNAYINRRLVSYIDALEKAEEVKK